MAVRWHSKCRLVEISLPVGLRAIIKILGLAAWLAGGWLAGWLARAIYVLKPTRESTRRGSALVDSRSGSVGF